MVDSLSVGDSSEADTIVSRIGHGIHFSKDKVAVVNVSKNPARLLAIIRANVVEQYFLRCCSGGSRRRT